MKKPITLKFQKCCDLYDDDCHELREINVEYCSQIFKMRGKGYCPLMKQIKNKL